MKITKNSLKIVTASLVMATGMSLIPVVANAASSATVDYFCLPAKPGIQHAMVRTRCLTGEKRIYVRSRTAGPQAQSV